jgi:alpha-1,3-mannosyl-glycoprotein beta-1,2-N-acetylglucosaminyltransferase
VSQDVGGGDSGGRQAAVAAVAADFAARGVSFQQHTQTPDAMLKLERPTDVRGYYHIASHYAWALDRVFSSDSRPVRVILLEDDMLVSPDFFELFAALAPVLDGDPTLFCVSAWNDNGQAGLAWDPTALRRTDFFPGLGWMLTAQLWRQLRPSWPAAFWDDWLRLNATRKGRQCVAPELCRTLNIGRQGTSGARFYEQHLRSVKLNTRFVPWSQQNLSYLGRPEEYRATVQAQLAAATRLHSVSDVRSLVASGGTGDAVLAYDGEAQFGRLAAALGAFREFKAGLPRGSFEGVVTLSLGEGAVRLILAPVEALRAARVAAMQGVGSEESEESEDEQTTTDEAAL